MYSSVGVEQGACYLFTALRDWGTNGYLYVHVPSETSAPVKKTLVLGTSGGLRHPGRERADDHAQDALPKLYPRRPRERSRNRSPSRAPSRRRSLFQRVDCRSCQSCPLRPPPFAHLRRFVWQTRHALLARGSPAPLECRRYTMSPPGGASGPRGKTLPRCSRGSSSAT